MERSQVLDAMGQLKLYGMKAAYEEIIATGVTRQHEPKQIVGEAGACGPDSGDHLSGSVQSLFGPEHTLSTI